MQNGGYRYGNRDVYYTGDGRMNTSGDFTFPRNDQSRRNFDDYRSYDRDRELRRERRYPDNRYPPREEFRSYEPERRYKTTDYRTRASDSPRYYSREVDRKELIEDERVRRMAGETPWGAFFIVTGTLLVLVGVPNAILCHEEHYYFRFWAGVWVMLLGVVGVWHRANYLSSAKNWSYIVVGLVAHTAVMVGCGLLCWRFVHQALEMITYADTISDYIALQKIQGVSGAVNISTETMVWTCLGLDCTTYAILWVNFLTLNGVVILAHNYWDANKRWTGKFEPLTRPFIFNPVGQMGVGQAMMFMGFVTGFTNLSNLGKALGNNYGGYWSPLWAGFIVIVAGGFMCAACKRPDHAGLVGVALFFEVVAFLATGASAVITTMGIVYDSQKIPELRPLAENNLASKQEMNRHIANLVALCVTAFVLCVSVLYGLWQIFRLVRFLATGNEHKRTPTISDDRSFSVYHRDKVGEKYPYPMTDKYPYPIHDRYHAGTKPRY